MYNLDKLKKLIQDKDINEFWIDDTQFKIMNGDLYYYAITFQWMKVNIEKLTKNQIEAFINALNGGIKNGR